jgi:D-alanine-D-alanine ligase
MTDRVKNKKDRVGVGLVFGGRSGEHDVSIESAKAVCRNIDRDRYRPELIYINKAGDWAFIPEETLMQAEPYRGTGLTEGIPGTFSPLSPWDNGRPDRRDIDIFFPVLHGPNGEDGKIQGLWELAGKPYVGANSMASTLAMDKAVSKILFRDAGLDTADFLVFTHNDFDLIRRTTAKKLAYPVFVKPCSLGSSVGISRVNTEDELEAALDEAFGLDPKIIIEQALDAREIEISVMGNADITVSRPGELEPHNEFYDYADKYLENKTAFYLPARLDRKSEAVARGVAERGYRALFLNGMSRVDLLLDRESGKFYINEINTIPGFTEISMFPKLFALQDIGFTELITRLIEYGFEYHKK